MQKKIFERPNACVGVICSRSLPPKNGRSHGVTTGRQNPARRQADRNGGDIVRHAADTKQGNNAGRGEELTTPTSSAMCATCRHRFAEMFFKEFDRDSRFTLSISPQRRRRETAERRAERYAARDEVTAKAKTKRRRRLRGCCRSARQMAKRCRKHGRRRQCCPGCGRR